MKEGHRQLFCARSTNMKVYKIRNQDGLFSSGGTWPRFTKKGKIWKARGHLTNHLNQVHQGRVAHYYDQGAHIVEYEVIEIVNEVSSISIPDYYQQRFQKRLEEQSKRDKRIQLQGEKEERALYEKLREKYNNE